MAMISYVGVFMKKLSAKAFEKRYLTAIFSLLGVFIVSLIIATILAFIPNMPLWIILTSVGIGVLSIVVIFVLGKKYKGRMLNLQQEIQEETYQKHLNEDLPIPLHWTLSKDDQQFLQGKEFRLFKEGLYMEDQKIIWSHVKVFKVTDEEGSWWTILTYDKEQESYTFKFPMSDVVIKLIETMSTIKLDDSELTQAENDHLSMIQSEIVWGHNRWLMFQKFMFIFVVTVFGLGVGILLGIYVIESSFSVVIANLIIIPSVMIVYPNRFKHYPKSSYLLNQKVIGYAKGRKSFIIPFSSIDSMSYDEHRLYINMVNMDDQEHPLIFYIPRDKYLIERLKEHMSLYKIDLQLIKL